MLSDYLGKPSVNTRGPINGKGVGGMRVRVAPCEEAPVHSYSELPVKMESRNADIP